MRLNKDRRKAMKQLEKLGFTFAKFRQSHGGEVEMRAPNGDRCGRYTDPSRIRNTPRRMEQVANKWLEAHPNV